MKTIEKLEDLTVDPENANEGTLRGSQLLERSLERYGAGRSIIVDKHGTVIGGNKTFEQAHERGLDVKVVPSDGRRLVVVQRMDLDLAEQPGARELAYLDNRTSELGLKWSPEQLERDLGRGIELGGLFTEAERVQLLDSLVPPGPPRELKTTLTFDNAAQHELWLALVGRLADAYPEAPSFSAKLVAWVRDQMARIEA